MDRAQEQQPLKRGLPPVHPGAYLREDVVAALGVPKTQIAQALGVSRQTLYDLMDEKQSVTAEMALRLGKLVGNGGEFWLALQAAWDLHQARQQLGDKLQDIPTLQAKDAA
jgi:addiction module HigA family antidote